MVSENLGHDELPEGVEGCRRQRLCEDVGDHAGVLDVVKLYVSFLDRFAKKSDACGDVLESLGRGVVFREHHRSGVVAEKDRGPRDFVLEELKDGT